MICRCPVPCLCVWECSSLGLWYLGRGKNWRGVNLQSSSACSGWNRTLGTTSVWNRAQKVGLSISATASLRKEAEVIIQGKDFLTEEWEMHFIMNWSYFLPSGRLSVCHEGKLHFAFCFLSVHLSYITLSFFSDEVRWIYNIQAELSWVWSVVFYTEAGLFWFGQLSICYSRGIMNCVLPLLATRCAQADLFSEGAVFVWRAVLSLLQVHDFHEK